MKKLVLILFGIFIFQATQVQGQKRAPVHFPVLQDDDQTNLFTVDVPSGSDINTVYNFALFQRGKSKLTVDYVLDDNPELTVKKSKHDNDIDLLLYSREISNSTLGGSTDYTITSKTVANTIMNFNGYKMAKLSFDYTHVISGANVTETGHVVMYIIKVTGASLFNTDEHSFIVRLKFDYQQNGGDDLSAMDAQIISTIKKATD